MSSQRTLVEPLLTAKEAAELLAVARRTLYVWAQAGRIPSVRIGRLVRFERAALERILQHEEWGW